MVAIGRGKLGSPTNALAGSSSRQAGGDSGAGDGGGALLAARGLVRAPGATIRESNCLHGSARTSMTARTASVRRQRATRLAPRLLASGPGPGYYARAASSLPDAMDNTATTSTLGAAVTFDDPLLSASVTPITPADEELCINHGCMQPRDPTPCVKHGGVRLACSDLCYQAWKATVHSLAPNKDKLLNPVVSGDVPRAKQGKYQFQLATLRKYCPWFDMALAHHRKTLGDSEDAYFFIASKLHDVDASTASNYGSKWNKFTNFCVEINTTPLPAMQDTIKLYLGRIAKEGTIGVTRSRSISPLSQKRMHIVSCRPWQRVSTQRMVLLVE